MTKKDLIDVIALKGDLTKKDSEMFLDLIGEVAEELLANGEEFKIPLVGKFYVVDTNARVGRNPQTGDEIEISACRVPKFKFSKNIRW